MRRALLRGGGASASASMCLAWMVSVCGAQVVFDAGVEVPAHSIEHESLAATAIAYCNKNAPDTAANQRVNCVVRNVTNFPQHGVSVVTLCWDDESWRVCSDRSEAFPHWQRTSMALAFIAHSKSYKLLAAGYNERLDDIEVKELGVYTSPRHTILYLPLRMSGTGGFNLSQWLLLKSGNAVDLFESGDVRLSAQLRRRLPKGSSFRYGQWPSPKTMAGKAPVYRLDVNRREIYAGQVRYTVSVNGKKLNVGNVVYERDGPN